MPYKASRNGSLDGKRMCKRPTSALPATPCHGCRCCCIITYLVRLIFIIPNFSSGSSLHLSRSRPHTDLCTPGLLCAATLIHHNHGLYDYEFDSPFYAWLYVTSLYQ